MRVRQQHEGITLTRNGEPGAVLVSVDDLEGPEITLEILGDTDAVGRISESLAGCHGARRGTYRIVQGIDEDTRAVHAPDIHHRSEIYRLRSKRLRWPGLPAAAGARTPSLPVASSAPGFRTASLPQPCRCSSAVGGCRKITGRFRGLRCGRRNRIDGASLPSGRHQWSIGAVPDGGRCGGRDRCGRRGRCGWRGAR